MRADDKKNILLSAEKCTLMVKEVVQACQSLTSFVFSASLRRHPYFRVLRGINIRFPISPYLRIWLKRFPLVSTCLFSASTTGDSYFTVDIVHGPTCQIYTSMTTFQTSRFYVNNIQPGNNGAPVTNLREKKPHCKSIESFRQRQLTCNRGGVFKPPYDV